MSRTIFTHNEMGMKNQNNHSQSCPCKYVPLCLSSFTAAEHGNACALTARNSIEDIVQRRDSAGNTPLHLAAQHGHVAVVSMLLSAQNCDVNAAAGGASPLHRACYSGAVACISLFIEEPSCDLLVADTSFGDLQTPLHKSASGGRYLAVRLLLEALAQRDLLRDAVTKIDAAGMTPLDVAREKRKTSEIERQTVVRWNIVAGGPPDWNKCVLLLENAASQINPMNPTCMATPTFALPDHWNASALHSSFQCDSDSLLAKETCFCVTASWERTFYEALEQTAHDVIGESSQEHATRRLMNATTGSVENLNKCERKADNDVSTSPVIGKECYFCGRMTIVLFPHGTGILVCKNCRHRNRLGKTSLKL
jgi:hypothetical protein